MKRNMNASELMTNSGLAWENLSSRIIADLDTTKEQRVKQFCDLVNDPSITVSELYQMQKALESIIHQRLVSQTAKILEEQDEASTGK